MKRAVFKKLILILPFFVIIPSPLFSKTIYLAETGGVKTILLTYGEPSLLRFDHDVKTISGGAKFVIKPADDDAPDYSTLSVMPRSPSAEGRVLFLLGDGTPLKIRFVTKSKGEIAGFAKGDNFFEIKKRDEPELERVAEKGGVESSGIDQGEKLRLMTALIRGEKIEGYEIKEVAEKIKTGLSDVSAELKQIYVGDLYNGYVFYLKNETRYKRYRVDIRKLRLGKPNLALLSEIDRALLKPVGSGKESAMLRVVAKKVARYDDIILPVRSIQKQGEK